MGFVAVIGVVVEFGHRCLRGLRPGIRPKDHPPTLQGLRPETAFLRLPDGTAEARPSVGGSRPPLRTAPGPGYAAAMRKGTTVGTLTRAELAKAVWREVGLSRAESERFVEAVIEEMTAALAAGGKVTILNFGSFVLRAKGARLGRNPKTGEPVPIAARRVVAFRPSRKLKEGVNPGMEDGGRDG